MELVPECFEPGRVPVVEVRQEPKRGLGVVRVDVAESGDLHQLEQLPVRVRDPRLVTVQLDELVRELPHFPGDEHQFGFATPVPGCDGESHDFVVVLQLLHDLPEAVADVRADLCFDLFADPLDGVLGDGVSQAEPFGSSVLEFLFNGVVLRGTERPVQEQPCGILFVKLVPVLAHLDKS